MANETFRLLAVIDPTRVEQWALQKAIAIARNHNDPKVYAFLSVFSDAESDDPAELRSTELSRHVMWLDELFKGIDQDGIELIPVVEWNEDWREAIALAANDAGVDLVIKQASGRPRSLTSSDRQLIRTLECALLLVKHDPAKELRKVLVAVDFNATDESHTALNDAILALGKRIRGDGETIELHAVSAYPESDKFVHPPDIAKVLDIDRSQAHVRQGSAADVIPKMANRIETDLVIVGNIGRRGLSGLTIGNTSEKILTDIEADVLVLVTEGQAERSAA